MSAPLCGLDEYGNLEKVIDASSGMPIGAVFPFYGATPPEHTMACNGAEISRTTYAELFAVIGTTAGEGDGSTTFNLPDLRGMFIRGTGGNAAELGVEQGDAMREIYALFMQRPLATQNRGDRVISLSNNDGIVDPIEVTGTAAGTAVATVTGSGQKFESIRFRSSRVIPTADEVRPVNIALTYCIVYEN